jgi:hypothetical protein
MTKSFRRFQTAVLFALVLGMPAPVAAQFPPSGFTVGEPFPDLAFPAVDGGRPMSMADFRGKRVILHIFASW